MKYNELILKRQKNPTRAGRGISAGRGKTAGRGTKGQGSRKSPVRHGFEGGQNPLYARLPKLRGFTSHNIPIEAIYTGQIDKLKPTIIDTKVLFDAGLISSPHARVKLILKGDITVKKQVNLQAVSKNAIEALTNAGGQFSSVERLARSPKKSDKKD
jgi:large subunit ribosomal protein L15